MVGQVLVVDDRVTVLDEVRLALLALVEQDVLTRRRGGARRGGDVEWRRTLASGAKEDGANPKQARSRRRSRGRKTRSQKRATRVLRRACRSGRSITPVYGSLKRSAHSFSGNETNQSDGVDESKRNLRACHQTMGQPTISQGSSRMSSMSSRGQAGGRVVRGVSQFAGAVSRCSAGGRTSHERVVVG